MMASILYRWIAYIWTLEWLYNEICFYLSTKAIIHLLETCMPDVPLKRPRSLFISPTKFLREVFIQGEDTGNKAMAKAVAAWIRSMRTAEGTRVFSKDKWLTPSQICRYFSRLATLKIGGFLHKTEEPRPATKEPVIKEEKGKMRRKTDMWLRLLSLEHGLKSEGS